MPNLRVRRSSALGFAFFVSLLSIGCGADDDDGAPAAGAGSGGIGSGGVPTGNAMSGAGGIGAAGKAGVAGKGSAGAGAGGMSGGGSGGAPNAGAGGSTPAVDAGATMDAGSLTEDLCGAIPTGAPIAAMPKAVVMHGLVEYHTAESNEFVGVHATLTVPAKPPPSGVIFAWPGTQALPDSPTYEPVGGGVLQPVLTWGQSCVPGALPGHSTWWISPVYVNSESGIPELNGCHGGPVIEVDVGDRLDLDMRLESNGTSLGTNWDQKVVDTDTDESTTFRIDLRGQQQQRVLFWIELKTSAKPTEDIIFEDVVLTMRDPEPGACALNNGGMNDYVSEARVSADGLHCCIDRIVLRAEGVPASTQDP